MTTRERLGSAALAVTLLAVYLATCSATPSVDTSSASLQGWRIATTGSPWLEDVDLDDLPVRYTDPPFWTGENETGHVVVYRSPGVTAVSTLAYLGRSSDPTTFSIRPASLLAAGLAWLAVLLVYGALRRHLSRRVALGVSAVLALGTPVWSVAADAMWPHTLTTLGIAGMAWAASRSPVGSWAAVGAFGGVALWGRLHASLIVAVLGLVVSTRRRSLRPALSAGVVSAVFLAGATAWSRWVYGEWDPAGGYASVDVYATKAAEGERWDQLVNLAGLWVSPGRGLLVVTPCILLLVPALVRSWRALPDWATALLLGGLAYSVAQGLMNLFAGGTGFYGYRLMLETMACAFPALALSAARAGLVARALLPGLLAAQAVAVGVGAVRDAYSVDPDEAWHSNALWWAVTDIPTTGGALVVAAATATLAVRVLAPGWFTPWRNASPAEQAHQRG